MKNDRIKLRAIEPEDIDVLFLWENDQDIWKVSNTTSPFSRFVLEQYIANSHQDIYTNKQLRLMIETVGDEKVTIGSIDLFDFDPKNKRAGIGILIEKEYRNNGYASEALNLLIDYAFGVVDLHQLYCNICDDNETSMKLFQNAGFQVVGVKKEWIKNSEGYQDEYLLQLIRK